MSSGPAVDTNYQEFFGQEKPLKGKWGLYLNIMFSLGLAGEQKPIFES